MSKLSLRDREMVALGAAVAANCTPCVEFHIPKAREAGISEEELSEVLALADKVRQVPARKVLEIADRLVKQEAAVMSTPQGECADKLETKGGEACC
ncbi:MAG: carboxymuconolactone decarboxylase family protein [Pseudomonadota bacterium]